MATVAVLEYTCPDVACQNKHVRFVQAEDGAVFVVPDVYCAKCSNISKMSAAILRKITSDQLSLARKRATENLNESVKTELDRL